ncbi:MAG: DUF4256 domain-containing protein [Patescibacteria group bacterium]|jgi:hypothetical protein
MKQQKTLSTEDRERLLGVLKTRFEKNMKRHSICEWASIQKRLEEKTEKLWSLHEMEKTGGEPDVVVFDKKSNECIFIDCSPQSPQGRRSLCYDHKAWEDRKTAKPKDTALDVAAAMGIELLTEEEYEYLQELGEFDTTTSSWVETPPEVRKLGGALFADRRFNRVFVFHNGADSYYAARGFRGSLRV